MIRPFRIWLHCLVWAFLVGIWVVVEANELTVVSVVVDPGREQTSCRIQVEHPQPPVPPTPAIASDGLSWSHGYLPPASHLPDWQSFVLLETVCSDEDVDGHVECERVLHAFNGTCGGSTCFLSAPLENTWSVCALLIDQGTLVCSPRWVP